MMENAGTHRRQFIFVIVFHVIPPQVFSDARKNSRKVTRCGKYKGTHLFAAKIPPNDRTGAPPGHRHGYDGRDHDQMHDRCFAGSLCSDFY